MRRLPCTGAQESGEVAVTTIDIEEVPREALTNAIGRLRTLRDHLLETGRPDLNQALLTIRSVRK